MTDKKYARDCVVCGRPFQTNRASTRTCSMECSQAWISDKNRRAYHQKKNQTRICKTCGKTYVGSDVAGFCSSSCRRTHYRQAQAAQRAQQAMSCPWAAGTISEDLRGVSPAWGF